MPKKPSGGEGSFQLPFLQKWLRTFANHAFLNASSHHLISDNAKTFKLASKEIVKAVRSGKYLFLLTQGRFPLGGIFRAEWYFLLSFDAHSPLIGL